jgi:DNA-binding CsgD family transcriptional regulator
MTDSSTAIPAARLRSALGLAADLAACHTGAEIGEHLKRLPALLGSDTILIGEVARADGTTLIIDDEPSGSYDPETVALFGGLWHQHPVVARHFAGPAAGALKISDLLSDRAWRRTELFGDCYGGRLGLGWELSTQIRFTPGHQACAALGRTGRDFDERDRAYLDVVNPHLRAGYARVEREAALAERLTLLERGLEHRGDGVLLVDGRGRIVTGRPRSRAVLAGWFDTRPGHTELPAEVDLWRRRHRGSPDPPALDLARGERRLRLRLVAGTEADAILLLERRDPAPDPATLARRLPITPREAEVLALLSLGHINASIALELGLSPHTVGRYVERLYAKLDVHNRAAATAAARDALDEWIDD